MRVEFIESEFWGAALLVAEADFKLAKTRMLSSTAWLMPQPLLQICLMWIIPLHETSTMQLWMRLRKTEQLFSRLVPHSIQNVDGLKF